jgi:outer membrane protein OmpA-like peptidoglycan-associated protein
MGFFKKAVLLTVIVSLGASSCSSISTKMKSIGIGCLAGLAAGALYDAAKDKANKDKRKKLQNQIGDVFKKQKSKPENKGKIVGLGVGCLAGLGAGYYLDTMADDMDQQLKDAGMSVRKIQGPDGETEELLINAGEKALEFMPDSTKLTPASAPKVEKIAEALQGYAETKIRIEGHVSAVKKDAFNTKLSQDRAEAVKEQILKNGVTANRFYKVVGMANEKPLPGIPVTDARNRRVEVYIRAEAE